MNRQNHACDAGCATPLRFQFRLADVPVWRCPTCGLYRLAGSATVAGDSAYDRSKFEDAFREHRFANYDLIFHRLAQRRAWSHGSVLDVGCSSGWFLEAAAARGMECFGVEPDAFFSERAQESLGDRAEVVNGFFPDDLPADWGPFDLITFHDVFEHLENPMSVLRACALRLAPGGILLLSVPSADGFVFQIGRALRTLGYGEPLERMFQVHFQFPHLYYHGSYSLQTMTQRAGYDVQGILPVPSFSLRGAVGRAAMDKSTDGSRWKRPLNIAALVGFALLQPLFPADNIVAILQTSDT